MSKTEFDLSASFIEWLGDNKLCPCRLDADFKVIDGPSSNFNTVYLRYGCIEEACAVWSGGCGLNPWKLITEY